MSVEPQKPVAVRVPKGLIFPISPRGPIPLEVTTLDGDQYALHIGGVSPLGGDPGMLCPTLCFRHQRLIFRMLSLMRKGFDSPEVSLQYSHLLETDGHVQRVLLRRTLAELGNTWMHRVRAGRVDVVRLLEYNPEIYYRPGVDLQSAEEREKEENIRYRLLRRVRFHDDFWRAFLNWSNCHSVRADVVARFSSDIAAACYLLLTPKAYHPQITESNKGSKDAAELLREIGAKVPGKKSDLRRIFERARGDRLSVLQSLAGVPTAGGYLCVDEQLEPNVAGIGFNIRFWSIRSIPTDPSFQAQMHEKGVLRAIWAKNGLAADQFDSVQDPRWRRLEEYEIERLNALGYSVERNRRFLELVRSCIGPGRFDEMIGAAYQAATDQRNPIRDSVDQWLTAALRNEFEEFAKRRAARTTIDRKS